LLGFFGGETHFQRAARLHPTDCAFKTITRPGSFKFQNYFSGTSGRRVPGPVMNLPALIAEKRKPTGAQGEVGPKTV
jgi:hypothetical protein